MVEELRTLHSDKLWSVAPCFLEDPESVKVAVSVLLSRVQSEVSNEELAKLCLQLISDHVEPCFDITQMVLDLIPVSPFPALFLEYIPLLAGETNDEMRLILSVCAEILQSDRSLVVPALGALTEIVLPESLRNSATELAMHSLGFVSEEDLPTVVRLLLQNIKKDTAEEVIRVIRKECCSLNASVSAVVMEVIHDHTRVNSSAARTFVLLLKSLDSWTFFDVMLGFVLLKRVTTQNEVTSIFRKALDESGLCISTLCSALSAAQNCGTYTDSVLTILRLFIAGESPFLMDHSPLIAATVFDNFRGFRSEVVALLTSCLPSTNPIDRNFPSGRRSEKRSLSAASSIHFLCCHFRSEMQEYTNPLEDAFFGSDECSTATLALLAEALALLAVDNSRICNTLCIGTRKMLFGSNKKRVCLGIYLLSAILEHDILPDDEIRLYVSWCIQAIDISRSGFGEHTDKFLQFLVKWHNKLPRDVLVEVKTQVEEYLASLSDESLLLVSNSQSVGWITSCFRFILTWDVIFESGKFTESVACGTSPLVNHADDSPLEDICIVRAIKRLLMSEALVVLVNSGKSVEIDVVRRSIELIHETGKTFENKWLEYRKSVSKNARKLPPESQKSSETAVKYRDVGQILFEANSRLNLLWSKEFVTRIIGMMWECDNGMEESIVSDLNTACFSVLLAYLECVLFFLFPRRNLRGDFLRLSRSDGVRFLAKDDLHINFRDDVREMYSGDFFDMAKSEDTKGKGKESVEWGDMYLSTLESRKKRILKELFDIFVDGGILRRLVSTVEKWKSSDHFGMDMRHMVLVLGTYIYISRKSKSIDPRALSLLEGAEQCSLYDSCLRVIGVATNYAALLGAEQLLLNLAHDTPFERETMCIIFGSLLHPERYSWSEMDCKHELFVSELTLRNLCDSISPEFLCSSEEQSCIFAVRYIGIGERESMLSKFGTSLLVSALKRDSNPSLSVELSGWDSFSELLSLTVQDHLLSTACGLLCHFDSSGFLRLSDNIVPSFWAFCTYLLSCFLESCPGVVEASELVLAMCSLSVGLIKRVESQKGKFSSLLRQIERFWCSKVKHLRIFASYIVGQFEIGEVTRDNIETAFSNIRQCLEFIHQFALGSRSWIMNNSTALKKRRLNEEKVIASNSLSGSTRLMSSISIAMKDLSLAASAHNICFPEDLGSSDVDNIPNPEFCFGSANVDAGRRAHSTFVNMKIRYDSVSKSLESLSGDDILRRCSVWSKHFFGNNQNLLDVGYQRQDPVPLLRDMYSSMFAISSDGKKDSEEDAESVETEDSGDEDGTVESHIIRMAF